MYRNTVDYTSIGYFTGRAHFIDFTLLQASRRNNIYIYYTTKISTLNISDQYQVLGILTGEYFIQICN
ncbi:hypothetical protein COR50_18995 [Chitinophaga caeni]|uniref:Uncharacterized protein n=1 Tax=Chitinophaga caeni TaxID=2029983 RepID=A0A291QYT2_9BACT|nr:hypothetical protein COR50_18995 [Chitinophaga caeni]